MKKSNQSLIVLKNLCAIFAILLAVLSASAQSVPPLINYQGKLTDQNGNPLSAGSYGIQFRLWDSPTASGLNDLIWDQQQTATLQSNGIFSVILGSPGGITIAGTTPAVNNLAYAFAGSNCFLGVTIAVSNGVTLVSPSEILPRQQLLSVPFAVQAQQASISSSLITNLANALCPAGSIMAFGGTNIPSGWMLCDGTAVSRTIYASLFASIGTAFGYGDNSTTFNLPDLRGFFLRGVDNGAGQDPDQNARSPLQLGGNSGNMVGSMESDALQNHAHYDQSLGFSATGNDQNARGAPTSDEGMVQGISSRDVGGGVPRVSTETRPKNVYVNYIIKY